MKAHRVSLKLYLEPGTLADPERVIPVFHGWIRDHALPELLIDVARYGHVHEGPVVLLVGRHADYAIHAGEGRLGLVTTLRNEGAPDDERLRALFQRAFLAASKLEKEIAGVRFRSDEFVLSIIDRLVAPNTDATLELLEREILASAEPFLGALSATREGEADEPFAVRLRRSKNEPVADVFAR